MGCSRTAIAKKVKQDENNPGVERYKNRYEVVIKDGKKCILLDDTALEEEKSKSKGFKNVINNSYNTQQDEDIIDIEPIQQRKQSETLIDFTERYINKITTLQETMYKELQNRDKQILLLTTSENTRQEEYFKTTAENKQLKQKQNVMLAVIITLLTLLIIIGSSFITFIIFHANVSKPLEEIEQSETINKKTAEFSQPEKTQPIKKIYI